MRACEGCRKRKIKCDAATTNSWPCAACVRLKLTCVPPTVNYNRAHVGLTPTAGLEHVLNFADSSGESDEGDDAFAQLPPSPAKRMVYKRPDPLMTKAGYMPGIAAFNPSAPQQPQTPQQQQQSLMYDAVTSSSLASSNSQYYTHPSFQSQISVHDTPRAAESESWPREEFSVSDLQNVMGSLKVHDNGTGM